MYNIIITILTLAAVVIGTLLTEVAALNGNVVPSATHLNGINFEPYDSHAYYFLQVLSMICLVTAGFCALCAGCYRKIDAHTLLFLILYGIASFAWTLFGAVTMPVRDFILSPNSPTVWLIILGVFTGTRQETWRYTNPVTVTMATFSLLLAFFTISQLKGYNYSRFDGMNPMTMTMGLTIWFAIYVAMSKNASNFWGFQLFRFIPLVGCMLLAFFGQNRGWIAICLFAFLVYPLKSLLLKRVQKLRRALQAGLALTLVSIIIVIACILARQLFPMAVDATFDRLDRDSRSEQYIAFFDQISPFSLIIGQGPGATYAYGNDPAFKFIDNQLLWMLFRGGVPIALGYTIVVLVPGFRLFIRAANHMDYAASVTIVLWTLATVGLSTFHRIGFDAQNYFILYLAGYCHARLNCPELKIKQPLGPSIKFLQYQGI